VEGYNELRPDPEVPAYELELLDRRNFLRGLGKWSLAVISGIALGAVLGPSEAGGGINTRGSWVNGASVGGWADSGTLLVNGGGGWVKRIGGGVDGSGGGWVNSPGRSWVNRRSW
jgi:hypothetical protein